MPGFATEGATRSGIALADRAALRATNPLSWRCVTLCGIAGSHRTAPFWRAGYVAEQICFILGRQLLRLAVPGQQYIGKICSDVLVFESIDTLGLFNVLTEAGDYGVFTFPTGDTDKEGNNKFVSRDLLDSVCELLFLERSLQISRRPVEGARYRRGIRQARVPCCDSAEQY